MWASQINGRTVSGTYHGHAFSGVVERSEPNWGSGGGVHLYVKLDAPISIHGPDDVRHNIMLTTKLGTDARSCSEYGAEYIVSAWVAVASSTP